VRKAEPPNFGQRRFIKEDLLLAKELGANLVLLARICLPS
jgi:hypothetical protein